MNVTVYYMYLDTWKKHCAAHSFLDRKTQKVILCTENKSGFCG